MRSLQFVGLTHTGVLDRISNAKQISVDYDTGNIIVATGTHLLVLDPNEGMISKDISLAEAGYLPINGSGEVVGLQYLPDQMSACVSTAAGDVVLWNVMSDQLECVGSVASGLKAMAWSPDQELVVFATGEGTLIMMTREFDPVGELSIQSKEFGEAAFVNVGWGKKETQFHGSEGKQAAQRKQEEVNPVSPVDDRKVRLSWRGDGQFFVVSFINAHTGARQLRVWTREMALHSTSEDVNGLEQALSWKPSGSLIVSSQCRPNKHDIVFFEKNGLRHGEFTLPFKVNEVMVKELLWNTDSCVLAIWCEEMKGESAGEQEEFNPRSYVQLWTVNNYHWYLKQSIEFKPTVADRVASVIWDPEHAYKIHIVTQGGTYLQYKLSWTTFCRMDGQARNGLANVAVIDGDQVLMTPLSSMVVPPPMSAYRLQLPAPATQVVFNPQSSSFGILLNNSQLVIYDFPEDEMPLDKSVKLEAAGAPNFKLRCRTPVLKTVSMLREELPSNPSSICHLTWVTDKRLIYCYHDDASLESNVAFVELSGNECKTIGETKVSGPVLATAVNPASGHMVLHLTDRTLLTYDVTSDMFLPFCDASGREVVLPLPCLQVALCDLGGQEVVLGLTDRFRFFVNDTEVANNCTSFGLHKEFLLLTTYSHTCRCINRNTSLKALPTLSDGKSHPFDESVRRVERGSRIVHVLGSDTRVVLQMPRGNLETIHPRALVLSAVRGHLDGLQFGEAFELIRKHRINMNLIHDHNPETFLAYVEKFVQQVSEVSRINLFLTDLYEEDVTKTMYTAVYMRETVAPVTSIAPTVSKIDKICDAVQQALQSIDPDKYLLSLLTAYVKRTKPQLDIALSTIKTLKGEGSNDCRSRAEEALKYLLFLVDVNELYDHALGTYDFDLVLMVAEKSQKDPKEYLPFLNELRHLEENYRYYTIDLHLKRYRSALVHIAKCGNEHFDECLKLVKDEQLYVEALRLFTRGSQQYKDVSVAYGSYLTEKDLHNEAGLTYSKAGEWELARVAFVSARNWRQVMIACQRLGLPAEQLSREARDLALKLKEERRHAEAACLIEQYAGDTEEAIVTLIQGCVWEEALRLMYKHDRTDFIESDYDLALVETQTSQCGSIDAMRADFERHVNRLAVVREKKERERLELLEGGGDHNVADADLFSDTSSATMESVQSSRSSRYSATSTNRTTSSRRSAKSKRKGVRKLWSLKEGSRHEDLALIEALSLLCRQADDLKEDVQSLLNMLVLFHHEDLASDVQGKFEEYLSLIDRCTPQIWNPDSDIVNTTSLPTLGPDVTTNNIVAAMQQQGRLQRPEVELEPALRIPPPMKKDKKWKLDQLNRQLNLV